LATGHGVAKTLLTHVWNAPLLISARVTTLDLPLITATVLPWPNGIVTT
jgi:hypothetical protein